MQQSWPRFLDDGNTIVYVSWPKEGLAGARLAVTSLRSPKTQVLDISGTMPLRMVDGHLLYVSAEGVLMAVPFDVKARKTTGAPIALIEGINLNRPVGAARVALSDSGTLVYLTGDAAAQLVTTDLAGAPQTLAASPSNFDAPAWSPDGRRIAVGISSAQGIDIWIYDIPSGVLSRVTSDGTNRNPVWSFDGTSLVFTSNRSGSSAVWWQRVDGSKPAEKLFEAPGRAISEATLSPDGHTLVYRTQPENRLYWVDLAGDRTAKPLTTERFAKVHPIFSRDGKWIAYTSSEGATAEVMVRPFPGPGGATQVSVEGGAEPVWGPDSKTVYYRHGRQVIAVSLNTSPTVSVASRRVLFEGLYVSPGLAGHPAMSISPDGKRFVFLRRTDEDSRLIVTTNWFTELRAKIGAKR
jgi:Tol biopolymer transport system component